MKIKTTYEGCPYITAGKVYDATLCNSLNNEYIITTDIATISYVYLDANISEPCGHLDKIGTWEVVEE